LRAHEIELASGERGAELTAGRYVELEVSDTGVGMAAETQARAFEAFFTTKQEGQGTGIGLATVAGVVGELGGAVALQSALGIGTAVTIVLPVQAGACVADAAPVPPPALGAGDTILVVEDHDAVRWTTVATLRRHGYRVLESQNAGEALLLAEAHPEIALVVTDVVMPRVGGIELSRRLRIMRPSLRVLFTSGHDPSDELRQNIQETGIHFLAKPFVPVELMRRVREALDGEAVFPLPAKSNLTDD